MREQIKVYVDGLFKDAALTIRNAEVQQEILQHTLDRYDDLIAADGLVIRFLLRFTGGDQIVVPVERVL